MATRKRTPEQIEKDKERSRLYNLAHPLTAEQKAHRADLQRLRHLKWTPEQREVARFRAREYRRLHPDHAREYYVAHAEEIQARARAKYQKDIVEQRERSRLKQQVYRSKHPDRIQAYRTEHAEELRARARDRYWGNGDKSREAGRVRSLASYWRHPERYRERARNERNRNRMSALVRSAKMRALKLGVAFDGLREIKTSPAPATCVCCGAAFDYSRKNRRRAPSLDRIDNKGGYISDNVKVICWECNWLKSEMSIERLKQILAYMES